MNGRILNGFLTHSTITVASVVVNIAIFALVSRAYGVYGLGLVALFTLFSFAGLGALADLGLSPVMLRALSKGSFTSRYRLFWYLSLFFLIFGSLLILLMYFVSFIIDINWVIKLSIIILPIYLVMNLVKQKYYSEDKYFKIGLIVLIGDLIRLLSIYCSTFYAMALIWFYAIPQAIFILLFCLTEFKYNYFRFNICRLLKILKIMLHEARYQIGGNIIQLLGNHIERIIFSTISIEALGIVDAIMKIPKTLLRMTGITQNVIISHIVKTDFSRLSNFKYIQYIYTIVFLLLSSGFAFFQNEIFLLLSIELSGSDKQAFVILLSSICIMSFNFIFNFVIAKKVYMSSIFTYNILFFTLKGSVLILGFIFGFEPLTIAFSWLVASLAVLPFLRIHVRLNIFSKVEAVCFPTLIILLCIFMVSVEY